MKFEITTAAIKHGIVTALIVATGMCLVALLPIAWIPVVFIMLCSLFYVGREVRDLQKSHNWNFNTWNSAEMIVPILTCAAIAAIVCM